MIWGQTGTRHGGTPYQIASVAWLWAKYGIKVLHDGDCQGVDAQLYHLAKSFGTQVILHPPTKPDTRAFCGLQDCVVVDPETIWRPERPYFVRDRDIVNEAEVMVGVPHKPFEQDHGGTWYTIRYARKQNKPLAIVWPNGHISYENWNLVAL